MADKGYSNVKLGKLKLKGGRSLKKAATSVEGGPSAKSRRRAAAAAAGESADVCPSAADMASHGGWWPVADESQVKAGSFAIECGDRCYLAAMDNGSFTVGAPHDDADAPSPEEVLALVRTPGADWVALKSGYGKFMGVDKHNKVVAVADAIGPREKWQVVFQDGKTALSAVGNNCFISAEVSSEGYVMAQSRSAADAEMVKIRTNVEREDGPKDTRADEDKKAAADCETAYVKMYQHSKVDLKNRCVTAEYDRGDATHVRHAQGKGNLHEVLLDRRSKQKSDRYCSM